MRTRFRVSVIGDGHCSSAVYAQARELGKGFALAGYVVVCGGLSGVMRAVCEGAHSEAGLTVGILPGSDRDEANEFVDIALATGLGSMRNCLVVLNSDVVVAVEGGSGTLSEIALALKIGKDVIALGRWSNIPGVIPASDNSAVLGLVHERYARWKMTRNA